MTSTAHRLELALFETPGFMDPETQHHRLTNGSHGRKGDFGEDIIVPGSDVYNLWVRANTEKIHALYPVEKLGKIAIISVDSGTNRLVKDVADELGAKAFWLNSKKISRNEAPLTDEGREELIRKQPDIAIVLEDFGTTGGTSSTTAISTQRTLPHLRVEVINTFQRQKYLPRLDNLRIPHHAIIFRELPTYNPEVCAIDGYCAQNVPLIG